MARNSTGMGFWTAKPTVTGTAASAGLPACTVLSPEQLVKNRMEENTGAAQGPKVGDICATFYNTTMPLQEPLQVAGDNRVACDYTFCREPPALGQPYVDILPARQPEQSGEP